MTSANRLNSTTADPSKTKRAERDGRDMSEGPVLMELNADELTMVGGAGIGKFAPGL